MEVFWKSKYIVYIIAGALGFIAPLETTMYFVGFLVMCDFVTGVTKAKKQNNISSGKMIQKLWVSIGYFISILISHSVELYFGDAIPIVKAVVAIIALTELQSLRENIEAITGTDIMKPISKFLQRKSEE